MTDEWIEIMKEEFDRMLSQAVFAHTVMICEPPITFFWDRDRQHYDDLSFGQHSFLKCIREEKDYCKAQYWRRR